MIYPEGPYTVFWMKSDGKSPTAQMQNQFNVADALFKPTNFVNITFSLNKNEPNKFAVVFIGPNIRISKAEFLKETNHLLTRIRIVINDINHDVTFMSLTSSVEKRMKYLQFGGYATIRVNKKVTYLGLDEAPQNQVFAGKGEVNDHQDRKRFVRSLISTTDLKTADVPEATSAVVSSSSDLPVYSFCSVIFIICLATVCFKVLRQRIPPR